MQHELKDMNYNLPSRVERDITKFAEKDGIEKVILFGSRAKKTNRERSDIDIAFLSGESGDSDEFYNDINENVHSLLMFDIVDLDDGISDELKSEIDKYGVTIYEKA